VTAIISAVVCLLYLQELASPHPHMTGCHYTHRSLNVFLFFYFMLKYLLDIYFIFLQKECYGNVWKSIYSQCVKKDVLIEHSEI
jgi:hypothetical protein